MNGQQSLSEQDYYRWSQKDAWTEPEAACLLSGHTPEITKLPDLLRGFPGLRDVINQAEIYPSPLAPAQWVQLALDAQPETYELTKNWKGDESKDHVKNVPGASTTRKIQEARLQTWKEIADVLKTWEAIFPKSRCIEGTPDYRDFTEAYIHDIECELGTLIGFALNQDNLDIDKHENLMRMVAKFFKKEGRTSSELAVMPVRVRKFVELYPTNDIDPRCRQWIEWVNEHKQLCELLNPMKVAKGSKRRSRRDQNTAVLQLREAAVLLSVKKARRIDKKFITVVKISDELHRDGTFENGELFSSKWRTSESIRNYLKLPHNPLSDLRFKNAKKDKKPSFNR